MMEVKELLQYLKDNEGEIKGLVLAGKYKPVMNGTKVEIPKENGKKRVLEIPTAIGRVNQQVIAQIRNLIYELVFVETIYGFRLGKSAHGAIRKCQEYLNEGYVWAADMDLEKFFDMMSQNKPIEILSRQIKNGRVISVIHNYFWAGEVYCESLRIQQSVCHREGLLSSLCASIMLNEMEHELGKRGWEQYITGWVNYYKLADMGK